MKHNLDTVSNKAEHIRLTSSEKFDMLQNLRAYVDANPVRTTVLTQSFWMRRALSYATAFVLVVGTGATSFAAEQAIPGDFLYKVKTGLNEGVVRVLPLTASAKAKVEVGLIDRRMLELERMVVENKDTPENVDFVMHKIGEHKDEFDLHIVALDQSEQDVRAGEIHSELETVVEAHIAVLEEITSDDESAQPEPEIADDTIADEPVVPQQIETYNDASVAMDAADENATDDSSIMMMTTMSLRTAPPEVATAPVTAKLAPAPEPVDPVVEELTTFSINEIQGKRFMSEDEVASTTERTQETRKRLRDRILERAEKELNIELDVSLFGHGDALAGEEN